MQCSQEQVFEFWEWPAGDRAGKLDHPGVAYLIAAEEEEEERLSSEWMPLASVSCSRGHTKAK